MQFEVARTRKCAVCGSYSLRDKITETDYINYKSLCTPPTQDIKFGVHAEPVSLGGPTRILIIPNIIIRVGHLVKKIFLTPTHTGLNTKLHSV